MNIIYVWSRWQAWVRVVCDANVWHATWPFQLSFKSSSWNEHVWSYKHIHWHRHIPFSRTVQAKDYKLPLQQISVDLFFQFIWVPFSCCRCCCWRYSGIMFRTINAIMTNSIEISCNVVVAVVPTQQDLSDEYNIIEINTRRKANTQNFLLTNYLGRLEQFWALANSFTATFNSSGPFRINLSSSDYVSWLHYLAHERGIFGAQWYIFDCWKIQFKS